MREISIKNNRFNIGDGTAVELRGDFKNYKIDISDNYIKVSSGKGIVIITYKEIRDEFPELAEVSDKEMSQAIDSIRGKNLKEARLALQSFSAFTTIATADWPRLFNFLMP